MNIQQINHMLSITDFLADQGVQPSHTKGVDWWYISPIRATERTPSFKVNTRLNRWYDHGTGEGGKIFDLALRLHPTSTVQEVIQLLSTQCSLPVIPPKQAVTHTPRPAEQRDNAVDYEASTHLQVLETSPLEKKSKHTAYLRQRGISLYTAKPYCREIDFSINARHYTAVGFENRSGGYELRNAWFKGSSSPKDITFIDRRASTVCLLEGFTDFLSLLQLYPHLQASASFLVLNSLTQLGKAKSLLDQHEQVLLYLDHDPAGKRVTAQLLTSFKTAADNSSFYRGYKDLNDYLVASQGQLKQHRMGLTHR